MSTSPSHRRSLWLPPLTCCSLLLAACFAPATPPTLYTLQPIPQQPLVTGANKRSDLLLIMPVRLAPHLQGRQLLIRQNDGSSRTTAAHLWSGPLDQQIGGLLADECMGLMATDNVAFYPGPRFGKIRYQVEVELNEFSQTGTSFNTVAVYTISDVVIKTVLARKTFRQEHPLDKANFPGYVACASQAVADLSRAIVTTLVSYQSSPSEIR